jgi:hypothetical protein
LWKGETRNRIEKKLRSEDAEEMNDLSEDDGGG